MCLKSKIKVKDHIFIFNIFLSIATPIYTYYNVSSVELDTWKEVYDLFIKAIHNPYVISLSLVSLWNNWYVPVSKRGNTNNENKVNDTNKVNNTNN